MKSDESVPKYPKSTVAITCPDCEELEQLLAEQSNSVEVLLIEKAKQLDEHVKLISTLRERDTTIAKLSEQVRMLEVIAGVKEK